MKKLISVFTSLFLVAIFAFGVLAADFVPSIEQKAGPDVIDPTHIVDPEGEKKDISGKVIITPYSEQGMAKYPVITEHLRDSYDFLNAHPMKDINPSLDELAKKFNPKYTSDNFIISDLFDVYLDGISQIDQGDYVDVNLDCHLGSGADTPVVMVLVNGEWQILDSSLVTRNEDGTVNLKLYQTGPIAFLKAREYVNPSSEPSSSPTSSSTSSGTTSGESVISNPSKSPQTGVNGSNLTTTILFFSVIVVALVASLVIVLVVKKKGNNQ